MPELPEVETVVKALGRALIGKELAGAKFLGKVRLPFDAKSVSRRLAGARVAGVRRRAKYIIVDFDRPVALLAHLGMTGYFHIEPSAAPMDRHERLVFPFKDGDELRYADARRFGFVTLVELPEPGAMPEELSALGPEPLSREFSARAMLEKAGRRTKCPVKVFIMDQTVVVGVGNIYASEALFAAGIDPRRPASDIRGEEWTRLVREVRAVLRLAIRSGGSTIRNYRAVDGSEGGFQRVLHVYGKGGEACPKCGEPVRVLRQGGRSTFFCHNCQV